MDPTDIAELEVFKCYLRGELTGRVRDAYEGRHSVDPADAAKVLRLIEITECKGTLPEARDAAGLSVGQAATVLGWARERIRELEAGAVATDAERRALCLAYDVAGWVAPKGGE